jgi:NTE family protein
MGSERPTMAVAYGGGGVFGIAYLLGVSEALLDGGVPLDKAPAIGTSAGSWAAAAMELGVRWSDFEPFEADIPRRPDPREGRLRESASQIFGERRACRMRAVACALPRLRREALSGADHPAADLVAASSAVPALLAPHRIGAKRYVDGGVRSMVSADLADAADHLLVMAPLAGPMFGPAGRLIERSLRREMHAWHRRNEGSEIWLIRPNHAIARLARRPDQLFHAERARECYQLAYQQGLGVLDRWEDGDPVVME